MISNPNSTSNTADVLRAVISPLREVTHIHSVHTTHPGHAEAIAQGLTRADYDAVIVAGGDGTIAEVINGLLYET